MKLQLKPAEELDEVEDAVVERVVVGFPVDVDLGLGQGPRMRSHLAEGARRPWKSARGPQHRCKRAASTNFGNSEFQRSVVRAFWTWAAEPNDLQTPAGPDVGFVDIVRVPSFLATFQLDSGTFKRMQTPAGHRCRIS